MVTDDDLKKKATDCDAIREKRRLLAEAHAANPVFQNANPRPKETVNKNFENDDGTLRRELEICEGKQQAMLAEYYRQQLVAEIANTNRTLAAMETQASASARQAESAERQAASAEESATIALKTAIATKDTVRGQWWLIGIGFLTVIVMIVGLYVQRSMPMPVAPGSRSSSGN